MIDLQYKTGSQQFSKQCTRVQCCRRVFYKKTMILLSMNSLQSLSQIDLRVSPGFAVRHAQRGIGGGTGLDVPESVRHEA